MCSGENPRGHMSYVRWQLAKPQVTNIEFSVNIANDPGDKVGLYFSPYNATIGGESFYFGIQNLLWKEGCAPQKGILFSRWGTRDLRETRITPGGWNVSLGNEGDFVSVRTFFDWKAGRYKFKISPVDEDKQGVWYSFTVVDAAGHETSAGSLRFPKKQGHKPFIDGSGTAFMEFYCGADSPKEVPYWKVSVEKLSGDSGQVSLFQATSEYPHPASYIPNVDVNAQGSTINLLIGQGVTRKHPASILTAPVAAK